MAKLSGKIISSFLVAADGLEGFTDFNADPMNPEIAKKILI